MRNWPLALGGMGAGSYKTYSDPMEACQGADLITTDVWTSMGYEAENEVRRKAFAAWCVDRKMMAVAAPNAIFMHCLPAHRPPRRRGGSRSHRRPAKSVDAPAVSGKPHASDEFASRRRCKPHARGQVTPGAMHGVPAAGLHQATRALLRKVVAATRARANSGCRRWARPAQSKGTGRSAICPLNSCSEKCDCTCRTPGRRCSLRCNSSE